VFEISMSDQIIGWIGRPSFANRQITTPAPVDEENWQVRKGACAAPSGYGVISENENEKWRIQVRSETPVVRSVEGRRWTLSFAEKESIHEIHETTRKGPPSGQTIYESGM
jgi:hypothetical protein